MISSVIKLGFERMTVLSFMIISPSILDILSSPKFLTLKLMLKLSFGFKSELRFESIISNSVKLIE